VLSEFFQNGRRMGAGGLSRPRCITSVIAGGKSLRNRGTQGWGNRNWRRINSRCCVELEIVGRVKGKNITEEKGNL